MAAAVASMAALVVIAFNLPEAVGRTPASDVAEPEAEPATEEPAASLFTIEQQDLECPDLNELDGVPQVDGERYEIESESSSAETQAWYECGGELENLETLYYDDESTDPTVRITLLVEVYDYPGHASVLAQGSLTSDYFAGWDHASHSSAIEDGRLPTTNPTRWMEYSLSAMDSNLVLYVDIDYLYTDEDFDAAAASQELAETVAESVVSQIPRS